MTLCRQEPTRVLMSLFSSESFVSMRHTCYFVADYSGKLLVLLWAPVPLSVASLVMEDVEVHALATYDLQLPYWKRYVDDVCTIPPRDGVDHLQSSIKFTVELESDGLLPFLDVKVCRTSDGSFTTSVHRKSTHTDKYLDFAPHHPLSHKRSHVRTLVARAASHSSLDVDEDQSCLLCITFEWLPEVFHHYLVSATTSYITSDPPEW